MPNYSRKRGAVYARTAQAALNKAHAENSARFLKEYRLTVAKASATKYRNGMYKWIVHAHLRGQM